MLLESEQQGPLKMTSLHLRFIKLIESRGLLMFNLLPFSSPYSGIRITGNKPQITPESRY